MHVAILKSKAKNHGGLEKAASRIASAFVARGATVSILTTGNTEQSPFHSSISLYATRLATWPPFLRMEQYDCFVQKWLKQHPAQIVFGMDRNRFQTHIRAGNGVHAAYLESRIATEGRLKYFTCLLNPMHRKILQLEKQAFEFPGLQKLFTNSHMVKEQVLNRFATDPAKIQVIHNGVEWSEMEADFSAWQAIDPKQFGLNPNRIQFLFIGNGYMRKGLDLLLRGLSKLKRDDFELSVIGKDNQKELFQAKAAQLGIGKQVHFFGPRTDIRSFYQVADVLTIPSFYDPFANVTVEALAMGLFVVSSKYNGGHEVLTSENGAIIEELADPDSMAETLAKALVRKKTAASAHSTRKSVEHLDYSHQMQTLIDSCL